MEKLNLENVGVAAAVILDALELLTQDERKELFYIVSSKYCIECGRKTDGVWCNCARDD